MDFKKASAHFRTPGFLEGLVGDLSDPFSIGLGLDPDGAPAVILDVVRVGERSFPATVQLGEMTLPLIVREGHTQARPL